MTHDRMVSTEVDLAHVAELLRARRRALQPEDVGFPRGRRRRTPGLRREEAAALCAMSTDYYTRLERRRPERHCGPRPSPIMLAGIARGLRFTGAERDRLFAAAGYDIEKYRGIAHLEPGVMHVLARLADTAALAVGAIGEVIYQTPAATALFGDLTTHTGWERSGYYRWFTNPDERRRHAVGEHSTIGAEIVADLRRSQRQGRRAATDLVETLLGCSREFAEMWRRTTSAGRFAAARPCHLVHPGLGVIELQREVLAEVDLDQRIVIYLAVPGSESHTKLKLSSVIGHHRFNG